MAGGVPGSAILAVLAVVAPVLAVEPLPGLDALWRRMLQRGDPVRCATQQIRTGLRAAMMVPGWAAACHWSVTAGQSAGWVARGGVGRARRRRAAQLEAIVVRGRR
eukprot:1310029-Lingulodinium_polyedra.AAC.1